SERVAVLTASERSLPARTYSINEGMLSKLSWTCPASRSVRAGAVPRYGTWTIWTPVMALNSSAGRGVDRTKPDETLVILPGLLFAYAMSSGMVRAGKDICATITFGTRIRPATGVMSRRKLKLRFG